PPSASTSRTRCPLAMPPTAGLHDICAIRSTLRVNSAVFRPMRAAAMAASQPAWPAPAMTTSYVSVNFCNKGETTPQGRRCGRMHSSIVADKYARLLLRGLRSILQLRIMRSVLIDESGQQERVARCRGSRSVPGGPITEWYKIATHAAWRNLNDVRKVYPHADFVAPYTVF